MGGEKEMAFGVILRCVDFMGVLLYDDEKHVVKGEKAWDISPSLKQWWKLPGYGTNKTIASDLRSCATILILIKKTVALEEFRSG